MLWMLGMMGSISLFRHAALVMMTQGMVMTLIGPAVSRALMFPLAYAFFLIPLGSELEPLLQLVTARMAIGLLWLVQVPAFIEGIFITIPNGYFRVAEACSGTAFLIAMAAYSTLVANLCFTRTRRRIGFVLFALVSCLIGNGLRAFGIIYFAYLYGVESAAVVDHIVYGWLFFAGIILFVMLMGRRWFDRSPGDVWFDADRLRAACPAGKSRMVPTSLLALLLMLVPFGWVHASGALNVPLPGTVPLPRIGGWHMSEDGGPYPWRPHFDGANQIIVGHYRDDAGRLVDLALVLFSHQEDGKELVGFGQGAAGPDGSGAWTWSAPAAAPQGAKGEILAGPGAIHRRAITFYRVGGVMTGSAGRVKLATLKARLMAGDQRAMAILLSTPQGDGEAGAAASARALSDFLTALGPVESLADRSLAID
jgi:EpsI family protein